MTKASEELEAAAKSVPIIWLKDKGEHAVPVVAIDTAKRIVGELERQLDEASGNILCGYCGGLDRKPEPWSSDAAMEIILEHLTRCPNHPLNQLAIAQERIATLQSALKTEQETADLCENCDGDTQVHAADSEYGFATVAFCLKCWNDLAGKHFALKEALKTARDILAEFVGAVERAHGLPDEGHPIDCAICYSVHRANVRVAALNQPEAVSGENGR
jgi:hypothetical protein